jgi:predicted RNA methylase
MNIVKYYFPILRIDKGNVKNPTEIVEIRDTTLPSEDQCIKTTQRNECYKFLIKNMQYTMESITYMSRRIDAELITGIIISHTNELGLKYENSTITDATAGIGGNTFSFATFFKSVISVENDLKTFEMLHNNVTVCNYTNVTFINKNYIDVMYDLKQDVVFIDPPWGGRNYKSYDSILLKLSEIDIEEICYNLIIRNNIVVLKLPLNYNFSKIYKKTNNKNIKVFIHKLKKMYIVVSYYTDK